MKKTYVLNAAQIVTPTGRRALKGREMNRLAILENGGIYMEDGIIKAIGSTEELLCQYGRPGEVDEVIDASGKAVLPGFVDSHTHLVFGGYRPGEFISRLQGTSYLTILEQGGGIQNTVKSTREASFESLLELGMKRLNAMAAQGVTTVEGKSGYGLDLVTEIKQLEVMKSLNETHPVEVVSTYLGAHAVPPQYRNNARAYVAYMMEEVLPVVKEKGLAEFADVFCEEGVFTLAESEALLKKAGDMGFKLKIHADEIHSLGGGELAARLGALSADHLLSVSKEGIRQLAQSQTVATLLPLTAFCLNHDLAPGREMIDSGCAVALATDYNPGSCFSHSTSLVIALSVIAMKLTIEEAITALTLNGAAALGRADRLGSLEVGKQGDLILLEYPDYRFLAYHTGMNIIEKVVKEGKLIWNNRMI